MQDSTRRVRKLRLSASNEDALGADVSALQDALRIASLPGIPPHGLLLVKKLDLGSFQSRSSAISLSQLIDARVRRLASMAVCADRGEHAGRELVWFSDAAQAALRLCQRVSSGLQPSAWYWHALFPSWRTDMSLAQTLTAIAADRHEPADANQLLLGVVEDQLASGNAEGLLNAITPQLAQALLRDAGLFGGPAAGAAATDAGFTVLGSTDLRTDWQELLRRAVSSWGASDPRCLWLGYSAFISCCPALSGTPALLQKIMAAVEALPPTAAGASAPGAATDEISLRAPAREAQTTTDAQPVSSASAPSSPAQTSAAKVSPPAAAIAMESTTSIASMQPAPVDAKRASSSFTHSIDEVDATGAGGSAAIENRFGSSHYGGLDHSESCGLLFLISLLERLAIGQLLSNNPALAEINLPAVVLRDIALRLRLPPSHPLLQALPHTPPVEHRIARLRVPSIWRDLAAAPEREVSGLHLFRSPAAAYHLTNRSRNILLHAGRGDLPEWTRQYRVTEHRGAYQPPRVADLSRSLQLLMSRYLRRHARMSLRQLVHRPGRIAATRTHLDALFDFQQMDIRIRRAGLDLNPGWVAWLARVVQFHYEEQDTEHV